MPSNKNQHFVPRVYLKNFSSTQGGICINLLNIKRGIAIRNAAIADQCSKDYFYGQRTSIENIIQSIETNYGSAVINLTEKRSKLEASSRTQLIQFALFQHLRTKHTIYTGLTAITEMADQIRLGSEYLPTAREAAEWSVDAYMEGFRLLDDLKILLISNHTKMPFFTSDDPVAFLNKWYEFDSRVRGKSPGMASAGAIVTFPISPSIGFMAYDGSVYSVEHENGWINVTNESEVSALNELQVIKAESNVYFNEWGLEAKIKKEIEKYVERRPKEKYAIRTAIPCHTPDEKSTYRVVSPETALRHDEHLVHVQFFLPSPSRWPKFLRWRPNGTAFQQGAEFLRAPDPSLKALAKRVKTTWN